MSSECNGKITKYEYDAAGRLVKEGKRSYSYSWLDKVSSVKENGVEVASFTYHMDGQIATAKANGRQENFLWDNLALISRNETEYVNEPYVTGGNPILADGDVLFNDMLGSTIGIRSGKEYRETGMTAFGETDEKSAMFTGKPYIGELGYAFLFRNYRPGFGKWQTSDPLGYPDGWNNLAYCNSQPTMSLDLFGLLNFKEGKFTQHAYATVPPSYYDTQSVDFSAVSTQLLAQTNMAAVSLLYPLAGDMAKHYLSNTGNVYNISALYLGDIFKSFGYIADATRAATSFLSSCIELGKDINNLSFVSSWETRTIADNCDAGLALHSFQFSVSGVARVQTDNSVKVVLALHVYDFYDFDTADIFAGIGLVDSDWRHLAEVGLACPYNVIGQYAVDFIIE